MDLLNHLLIGFENAVTWDEPALLLRRRDFGYACRSTARHGPRGHRGDAPSHHVCA